MYLLSISFGLCFLYVILRFVFALFFQQKPAHITAKTLIYFGLIFALSLLSYVIAARISDPEFSNRVLHGSGGFLAFFVCFLVVKDSKITLNAFQFFLFSALIVTMLGVANEVMEFFLQNHTSLVFAESINDTWLDLVSNSIGIFVAGACLTPFARSKNGR